MDAARTDAAGLPLRNPYALERAQGSPPAAVLSLAIGIGANTALFTLIDTVMWKLLPVRDPETLLALGQQNGRSCERLHLSAIRVDSRSHPGVDLAAYSSVRLNVSIDGAMRAHRQRGSSSPANIFRCSGYGRLRTVVRTRRRPRARWAIRSSSSATGTGSGDSAGIRRYVGRQISISGTPFDIVGRDAAGVLRGRGRHGA